MSSNDLCGQRANFVGWSSKRILSFSTQGHDRNCLEQCDIGGKKKTRQSTESSLSEIWRDPEPLLRELHIQNWEVGWVHGAQENKTNKTTLDVTCENRHDVLRQKRLLIGCGGGFQQECSQSYSPVARWITEMALTLTDESQQHGNILGRTCLWRTVSDSISGAENCTVTRRSSAHWPVMSEGSKHVCSINCCIRSWLEIFPPVWLDDTDLYLDWFVKLSKFLGV